MIKFFDFLVLIIIKLSVVLIEVRDVKEDFIIIFVGLEVDGY